MIDILVISSACFTAINRNIYRLFHEEEWKIEIVVPGIIQFPAGEKQAQQERPGDPPLHLLQLKGANPRRYLFPELPALLNKKKPRIVLVDNDPISRLSEETGKWCRANGAQLYCISCENLSLGIGDTIKRRGIKSLPAALWKRMMIRRTRKVVSGIFTINTDGKKIFEQEGYKNVHHIPLGFDPVYFNVNEDARRSVREQLKLQHKTIAYFGRITPEKGVTLLIEALSGLMQYDWHLMMDHFDEYVSGYNQEVHQLLTSSGVMERVVFVSPDHFGIGAYMNAADMAVVPSVAVPNWKEQYGRVAAEALACGTLVIASNSGALPELLRGNGIIFPEGNVEALRSVLEEQIKNKTYTYPHRQAAEYARTSLSMQKQKSIMEQVFAANGIRVNN